MFDPAEWSAFQVLIGVAIPAALLSLVAGLSERRQRHRPDPDRISPVPWGLVSVLSAILAMACFATALHAG